MLEAVSCPDVQGDITGQSEQWNPHMGVALVCASCHIPGNSAACRNWANLCDMGGKCCLKNGFVVMVSQVASHCTSAVAVNIVHIFAASIRTEYSETGLYHFIPYPFQYIIHYSSRQTTLCSLSCRFCSVNNA